MEKLSYALGLSLASNLKSSGIDKLDFDAFLRGAQHFYNSSEFEMTPEQAHQLINNYFQTAQQEKSSQNIAIGREFLEKNGKLDNVVVLPSGLQYTILQEGGGRTPNAADSVKCHYHGMLLDGSVFDSSVERGEPAVFGVSQVIAGWVEALQLMKEGSKYRLFIPSELAYGEHGAGSSIAPHATLIFDVELIEIQ